MEITRRDLGKIALASVPLSRALAAKMIDSKFGGVQIGAITYSFNRIASPDPEAIIKAYVEIGLGEARTDVESLRSAGGRACDARFRPRRRSRAGPRHRRQPRQQAARRNPPPGAPPTPGGGGGRTPLTPEQQAERQAAMEKLAQWRASTSADTWKAVTKKFNDAGVDVALLCYNMQDSMKDEDIEYGFAMAKGLGVKAITTSTTLTMAKRIAPDRRQAQDDGGLSRPRRHQRPQPDRHARKLRHPDGVRQIQRHQPRHRPLHRRRSTTPWRSSSSTTTGSPTCT